MTADHTVMTRFRFFFSAFKDARVVLTLICLLTLSALASVVSAPASAQEDSDGDGILDVEEMQLAQSLSPQLVFTSGEDFFPVDVEYFLEDAQLYRWNGGERVLVDSDPSLEELRQVVEDSFITSSFDTLEGAREIYGADRADLGYTVYARVSPSSGSVVVQYWFFYVYNMGSLNEHEGDWEMIQIQLDPSMDPESAAYSQHHSGERTDWVNVEKVDGSHPVVYVALGSHANYFRSYQGRLGFEGDTTDGSGLVIQYSESDLRVLGELGVDNHPSSQHWLDFGGRWGNWQSLPDAARGLAGPFGPAMGDNSPKWVNPSSWALSVAYVDSTWFTLSFLSANSLFIFLAVILVLGLLKARKIVRLMRSGGLRIGGFLGGRSLVAVIIALIAVFLYGFAIFSSWYGVSGDIETQAITTEGTVNILMVDGIEGIQVNTLREGHGMSTLFTFAIPFGILLVASILFLVLDLLGAENAGELRRKFLVSSMTTFVLAVAILVFVVLFAGQLPQLVSAFGQGTIPSEVGEIASEIAASPVSDSYEAAIGPYDSVTLTWGLGLGAYLFLASAILKAVGGLLVGGSSEPGMNREGST